MSEVFPLEVRAQAIAVFFAIAQCFGALGPVLYGHLIGNGTKTTNLFIGYLIGAGAMVLGGIVEIFLGIAAEGKSLEDVANPLSMVRRPVHSDSGMTSGSAGQVWRPNQTDWAPDWSTRLGAVSAAWRRRNRRVIGSGRLLSKAVTGEEISVCAESNTRRHADLLPVPEPRSKYLDRGRVECRRRFC